MADKKLSFESGVVTYNINDKCEVSFNPTDPCFVTRLADTFDSLESKNSEYKKLYETTTDPKVIFDIAKERDAEMRNAIDELFDKPVCDALFGSMNVYALADGLPLWCNFMLAIVDEVNDYSAAQKEISSPRLKKYLEKYKRN